MKLFNIVLFITTLTIGTINPAEARNFKIGVVGSYGITNIDQTVGSGVLSTSVGSTKKSHNLGGGALIEFGLFGPLGLEVGALYQPKGFKDGTTSDEVKYSTRMFTAMLRFDFGESSGDLKLPLSLGLGAYYSKASDNQVTVFSGTTEAKKDFSDSTLPLGAIGKIDRGLIGSLAVDYPVSKNLFFTFDIRYLYGLTDVVTPSTFVTGSWTEINTLAGIVLKF